MTLTPREAYDLHIRMWADMQKELGDNPMPSDRYSFKRKWCAKWCEETGYSFVLFDCFLCELTRKIRNETCAYCIVDWSMAPSIRTEGFEDDEDEDIPITCTSEHVDEGEDYYIHAPISEILALPTAYDIDDPDILESEEPD